MILDLSSPEGRSVNDGIDQASCSLSYVSIDDVAAAALRYGRGALIAKSDIAHAYRQVPVHPEDRSLLGMQWKGRQYVDCTLPFGLRSAPTMFSAVADAVEWIVRAQGVPEIFHYLDDFIIIGPPAGDACERHLHTFLQTCESLGVIVASRKTEGPSTCLTVLGIEIDTNALELRLPVEKLEQLANLLGQWRGRRSGSRVGLESLAGLLQHACKVVRPGRTFTRRIYNLLAQTHHFQPHFTIRLSAACRADIEWWCTFLRTWNGTAMLRPHRLSNPDLELWSDASGSWGCGAYWQGLWFQVRWEGLTIACESISAKELFPIVVAALVWGREWRGLTVQANCDNSAVVDIVNHQTAKDDLLCHLMRCLFFACAHFDVTVVAKHTPGICNGAADALSRNNLSHFSAQVPHHSSIPTFIPPDIPQGLSAKRPTWTSQEWTAWFSSIMRTL